MAETTLDGTRVPMTPQPREMPPRRSHRDAIHVMRELAESIDEKDAHTRAHSDRVAFYAAALAAALGLETELQTELMHAGRMHDIGKIGVSDRILLKPGRLTSEEFEIVKLHSAEGERRLAAIGEHEIALWIRHHHERWDGRGYPDGLIGSTIPLESRILAVADALDAMTTDRSYALGVSFGEAADEIEANAGTQFDPEVAEAMVELIRTRPGA